MAQVKKSGRDRFRDLFCAELDQEAQWLRLGSVDKVDSIELFLKRNGLRPQSMLELGCGTGAVISECQRRQLASDYTAVDYSPEAIAYLSAQSRGIRCVVADITTSRFHAGAEYDLVLLSHVIEHLEDPLVFLRALVERIRFTTLIVEVPLEDLLASRLKNVFKDRLAKKSGHVQFFTPESFRSLLRSAGLILKDERLYVPSWSNEMLDLITIKDGLSPWQRLVKRATQQYLPRLLTPVWQRWYYAHIAALCAPADQ